ncbi:MAG: 4-(cytidine 5'-diphospho)-2-C-methyl-D-erythritol kinase [Ignavibacteria bacterium]
MKQYLSPAKINIGLNIVSKRDDGYHNIETIFYPINLFDRLIFKESKTFEIVCSDPSIPVDEKNLIYKARNVLSEFVQKPLDIRIELEKTIPVFAGLGGGSSNAAITLIALNEIFELKLSNETLLSLASKVGSDVPFFILKSPAYAEGRGEILQPLPDFKLNYKIILIIPEVKISTAWAYSNFKSSKKAIELSLIKTAQDFEKHRDKITNDFEEIVFPVYPELRAIKNQLLELGAVFALLSGSGSAIYGLFEPNSEVDLVINHFKNFRVFIC